MVRVDHKAQDPNAQVGPQCQQAGPSTAPENAGFDVPMRPPMWPHRLPKTPEDDVGNRHDSPAGASNATEPPGRSPPVESQQRLNHPRGFPTGFPTSFPLGSEPDVGSFRPSPSMSPSPSISCPSPSSPGPGSRDGEAAEVANTSSSGSQESLPSSQEPDYTAPGDPTLSPVNPGFSRPPPGEGISRQPDPSASVMAPEGGTVRWLGTPQLSWVQPTEQNRVYSGPPRYATSDSEGSVADSSAGDLSSDNAPFGFGPPQDTHSMSPGQEPAYQDGPGLPFGVSPAFAEAQAGEDPAAAFQDSPYLADQPPVQESAAAEFPIEPMSSGLLPRGFPVNVASPSVPIESVSSGQESSRLSPGAKVASTGKTKSARRRKLHR